MANFFVKLAFVLCAVSLAMGDVYMHSLRGSNNRLDESNRNRANANRMFDSQNNNKGGYNVNTNPMYYYAGSILNIEWTNQHGCGDDDINQCQIVLQYMCDEGTTGNGIRDGQSTNRIDSDYPNNYARGRHESGEYYTECSVRERNKGLFTADQSLNSDTAEYTRQNTNGATYGFECPEERDYYPYWHPTPWIDVAVMTTHSDMVMDGSYTYTTYEEGDTLCDMYEKESQNTLDKGHCIGSRGANHPAGEATGAMYNNQASCEANAQPKVDDNGEPVVEDDKPVMDLTWVVDGAHNKDYPFIQKPECMAAPWSRYNHLGNGIDGYALNYDWKLPRFTEDMTCAFRLRYNMSTNDYNPWTTFSESNDDLSVIEDNPEDVELGTSTDSLQFNININTDQAGRTFQDRSHTFHIRANPPQDNIINLNVKGQRGNIVQNYPSVEYDFTPNKLEVPVGVMIHRQLAGSLTSPNGAGQGTDGQDKSNFVQIDDLSRNYPTNYLNQTMIAGKDGALGWDGMTGTQQWATLGQFDDELDGALPYQDFGLMAYNKAKTIDYMSSRTNNFSNRSQKGRIVVTQESDSTPEWQKALIIASIVIGSAGAVAGIAGAGFVAHKKGWIPTGGASGVMKTPSAPAGYV